MANKPGVTSLQLTANPSVVWPVNLNNGRLSSLGQLFSLSPGFKNTGSSNFFNDESKLHIATDPCSDQAATTPVEPSWR